MGAEERYDHTASERHVPCFMIWASGTPFWKAQEAPPLLKSWNVIGFGTSSNRHASLRCFLATELSMESDPWALEPRTMGHYLNQEFFGTWFLVL